MSARRYSFAKKQTNFHTKIGNAKVMNKVNIVITTCQKELVPLLNVIGSMLQLAQSMLLEIMFGTQY